MRGDKYRTEGEMNFKYKGLKIDISDKDGDKSSKLKHFLIKNIGSIFYRNEITPEKGASEVEFETKRDVRKGFTGQWIDGLLRGTLETVIKPDEEKIDKFKAWFDNLFPGKEEDS
jgi:hypothetical protein